MQQMRFSIIITCYNQRNFIGAAVDSALAQTHPMKEIIVVDDGSSDGSAQFLEQYGEAIHLVKMPRNQGATEARNQGAARAQGEYLAFLDGDDILTRWALDVYERFVAERHPKMIFGQCYWFEGPVHRADGVGTPHQVSFVEYQEWMAKDRSCGLSASLFVAERQAFQQAGGWTSGLFYLDLFDIGARMSPSGRAILICSPPTAFYRVHAGNSIHHVPPFIKMAHHILAKERAGEYPGSREHRFVRYAWFGGMVVFWTKRGFRAGLYREALRLAASGLPMILAAVIRRSLAWAAGRQPVETLTLQLD